MADRSDGATARFARQHSELSQLAKGVQRAHDTRTLEIDPTPARPATHPPPEEGDDADSSGGDTGGTPAGDANTARGDRGDSHADPRPDAGFASLDAEILSRRLANGMLSVSMGRCELDLKVVLAYVGDDRGVVVVQEDDTDTEPPSDEPVDSDDAK